MRRLLTCFVAVAFIADPRAVANPQRGNIHSVAEHCVGDLARASGPIVHLGVITSTSDLCAVGREVSVRDVRIERIDDLGFWVSTEDARDQVFVVPAEGLLIIVETGETVSLHGEVRTMPWIMRSDLYAPYAWDENIYVYAFTVRPAWPSAPSGKYVNR